MGPSGCGKTTFISALAGRARFDGRVLINGVKYDDGLAACGGAFALCPQEDVMYRNLTVGENVWLSATLRLGRPRAEVNAAVDAVLASMSLLHRRDAVVGDENVRGVSGGERKRTNVAMELVADPECLFIDEVTTGLDAAASKEVVTCLRRVAATRGITVASVLHQPRHEVFALFDELKLISRNGHMVYQGPPCDSAVAIEGLIGVARPPLTSSPTFSSTSSPTPTSRVRSSVPSAHRRRRRRHRRRRRRCDRDGHRKGSVGQARGGCSASSSYST